MAAYVASFALLALGGAAAVATVGADDPPAETTATMTVVETVTVERLVGGHGARYWRRHNTRARADLRRLRRVLATNGTVGEALGLACTVYGYCDTLRRKALCETGGTLSPRAYNRSSHASGLFQFLPSTWSSTPYGRFSVWSAYANALAAGWMHSRGRGGEWVCR